MITVVVRVSGFQVVVASTAAMGVTIVLRMVVLVGLQVLPVLQLVVIIADCWPYPPGGPGGVAFGFVDVVFVGVDKVFVLVEELLLVLVVTADVLLVVTGVVDLLLVVLFTPPGGVQASVGLRLSSYNVVPSPSTRRFFVQGRRVPLDSAKTEASA